MWGRSVVATDCQKKMWSGSNCSFLRLRKADPPVVLGKNLWFPVGFPSNQSVSCWMAPHFRTTICTHVRASVDSTLALGQGSAEKTMFINTHP